MGTFSGTEAFFRQVVRHLGALDRAGGTWKEGPFSPAGISFSVESQATLSHGEYGPMRDFPTPDGFDTDRWSLHTKFTGGTGGRMYYKTLEVMERDAAGMERRGMRVAIGYVGPHLPTVRFH